VTELLQRLSLAILFAITGGFAFLYIRHGTKVRPDHRCWPDSMSDGGGSGSGND
jgi:hypothetical protein